MNGVMLIEQERNRVINKEGYDAEHDDAHSDEELCSAATAYLLNDHLWWPFEGSSWKPSTRIRDLAKAGQFIAAEIDRLLRLEASENGKP